MFGTSGIRGAVGDVVTGDVALSIGRALAAEGYETVIVGRDPRESGRLLTDALTAGLREGGSDVIDVGVEATPTVARAIDRFDGDAGVVITASHNPAHDNGFKLWTPSGKAFGPDREAAIAARLESGSFDLVPWDELGTRRSREDAREHHAAALRDTVTLEDPPRVVVDVGNGAGEITASVLTDLGCAVETLNAQPDGTFPGRPSEPTQETLGTLCAVLESTDAALGIAHDGDADRMLAVDETGAFVPKDSLLALFGREAAGPNERIAAPVDTSIAVDDALATVGASVDRTKVGDVHVAERTLDENVVFGGEPSGAWIWPAETRCPDGPLAACKLVELVSSAAAPSLSSLVADIDAYPIKRDSIPVTETDRVMSAVAGRIRNRYDDVDELDGVRVDAGDGWFLVRASGTEPVIRITSEAREEDRSDELFAEAREIVDEAVA